MFADHLNVGSEFFYTSTTGPGTPAFFRSLRTTKALDRRRARHKIEVVYELVKALETRVRLPDPDVPDHPVTEGQGRGPKKPRASPGRSGTYPQVPSTTWSDLWNATV